MRGPVLTFVALMLALPARVLAAPGAESSVTLTTNPLVVYAVVAVLVGAVAVALFVARPRHTGLGPKPFSPQPHMRVEGLPWMPGGDILGANSASEQLPAGRLQTESWPTERLPTTGAHSPPPPPSPIETPSQPANPWSTGAPGAPPHWG